MDSRTNYTFPPMQSKTNNGSNNLFEDNFSNTVDVWTNQYIETFTCTDLTSQGYYSPLPYHLQNDWMNNAVSASSPSLASTPENSPTMTSMSSPHPSHVSPNNVFPQNRPTGPTASEQTESIKEIQRLSQAKSVCLPSVHTLNIELQLTKFQRRRQQNRESQRAFRERKNKHIEQLEQALADLQHRHEKLLQCFVGLTAKVSSQNFGGNIDMSLFHATQPQLNNLGSYPSGNADTFSRRNQKEMNAGVESRFSGNETGSLSG